jgi:hypothetical protein
MSYGEHQERVGLALVRLLHHQTALSMADEADAETVVECRRQALLALRDRVALLGTTYRRHTKVRVDRVTDAGLYPLHVLNRIIDHLLPEVTGRDPVAPTLLLTGPPPDAASALAARAAPAELWRAVARHLLLGNADLDTAADPSWRQQDPPAWYLVGDTARTLEAFAVLAEDPVRPRRRRADTLLEHRLAASTVARIADWYGTDPSPDLAVGAPATHPGVADEPVIQLIGRPEDFARAQRALAGFLRPMRGRPDTAVDRVGLLAARAVAAGQIRLSKTFATWANATPACAAVAKRFRARIPLYLQLQQSMARLTELEPARSPLIISQQSELVQRLRRFPTARLSPAALHHLDEATHWVAVTTGKALRVEGMCRKNILILDTTPDGPPGARPITNTQEPFHLACRRLANAPAPPEIPFEVTRAHRTRLAAELAAHRPFTHPPAVRRSPSP